MSDDPRLNHLAETLRTGLTKRDPMPLRRHKDDSYWDELIILSGPVVLHGTMVPRYKTSGLSGDEWRVHAQLVVKRAGNVVVNRGFHRMNDLLTHAPGFVYAERDRLLDRQDEARLVFKRKGHSLTEQAFPTFGDAAMGVYWHGIVANEGTRDAPWNHLSDEQERGHCQQVGCAAPPKNFYRLKKILYGDHSPDTFLVPKYDFEGQYVWYCARHTRRGDCGYEDADANLELVKGGGVARQHEEDESPSGLAVVDLSKDDG